MADNVTLNPGVGGSVVATDDIGAVQFQRIKLTLGADGVNDGDVASANPLPVQESRPSSATLANIAASATNVTLFAANSARRGALLYNDSGATLFVKFGATASATDFTLRVEANGYFELPQPCYTGIIDGLWQSATGTARVTEL